MKVLMCLELRMRLAFAALINDEEMGHLANECSENDMTVIYASFVNTNHLQVNLYGVATFYPSLYDIAQSQKSDFKCLNSSTSSDTSLTKDEEEKSNIEELAELFETLYEGVPKLHGTHELHLSTKIRQT